MDDIDDVLKIVLRSDRLTPNFMDIPDQNKYRSNPEVKALASQRKKYLLGGWGGGFLLSMIFSLIGMSDFGALVWIGGGIGGTFLAMRTKSKIEQLIISLYVNDLRSKYQDIKANMSRAEWETYKVNLHTSMNTGR